VPRFEVFGGTHLAILSALLVAAVALVGIVRVGKRRARLTVRALLILTLLGLVGLELTHAAREGWLTLEIVIPFHLCDAAILMAVFGLITLHRGVVTVLYFWTCAGTLLAILTPDLPAGLPVWAWAVFFGLHGTVLVSALVLVFGLEIVPARGAPWRVFLITNAYAGVVGLVNLFAGTNYLFLCRKPAADTLLDLFGPWPAYIFVADVVAFGLFWLLGWPFRRVWRREARIGAPSHVDRGDPGVAAG
jgi:hypothetical integral membrane protein (TIGR02206 family)